MKAYREQVDKGEILDRTLVFKLIFDGGGGGSSSSSSGSGGGGGGGGGGGRGSGGDSDVDLDKRIQSFVTATEEKARSGFQAPERKPDDSKANSECDTQNGSEYVTHLNWPNQRANNPSQIQFVRTNAPAPTNICGGHACGGSWG